MPKHFSKSILLQILGFGENATEGCFLHCVIFHLSVLQGPSEMLFFILKNISSQFQLSESTSSHLGSSTYDLHTDRRVTPALLPEFDSWEWVFPDWPNVSFRLPTACKVARLCVILLQTTHPCPLFKRVPSVVDTPYFPSLLSLETKGETN